MRILFLTYFYPPDLSACSFRMGSLISHLIPRLPAGSKVDLFTTKPNRYASFDIESLDKEEEGPLTIERIQLPPHKSGMLDQARAFATFDRAVAKRIKDRKYDLVFVTTGRLMSAFLAARIASRIRAPLFIDIRDIFVDTIKDVLPGWRGRLVLPILDRIEKYSFGKATLLSLVSEGFKSYFKKRYPIIPTIFFTNGIDDIFIGEQWEKIETPHEGPIRVLYAGNIGEGQGLHKILPQLATLAGERYKFIVVGDGGRKSMLVQAMKDVKGSEVEFLPPVDRIGLIQLYKNCDILFLHLNNYEAFAKVLPSKIFEYAATGKPILAGVGGFFADFLHSQVDNCQIFPPCDAESGFQAMKNLTLRTTARTKFVKDYARNEIMERMAETLIQLGTRKPFDK